MFAIVRTGGKQYRVAADTRLVVDRLEGEPGDRIALNVLMSGEAGALGRAPVTAEIVEHVKGDKVIVFKKKRRHNYRRKNGHRQLHTVLRIVALGDDAVPNRDIVMEAVAVAPEQAQELIIAEPAPMLGEDVQAGEVTALTDDADAIPPAFDMEAPAGAAGAHPIDDEAVGDDTAETTVTDNADSSAGVEPTGEDITEDRHDGA